MTTHRNISDYIPYACHYSPDTLLTKNGELLQVIKIVGFTYQTTGKKEVELREIVRKSIFKSIDSDKYAFWFNTIRRKQNLSSDNDYPVGFSDYLNQQWNNRHDWGNQYINELYITVVKESGNSKLKTPKEFFRTLTPNAEKKYRDDYLKKSHAELDETVSNMMKILSLYGAKKLTTIEEDGTRFSEPIQFVSKIANLVRTKIPVLEEDISKTIANNKINFGFNALEVSGDKGKRYAAILTIKEYKEKTATLLDEFLQLPIPFNITQLISLTNRKEVISKYSFQKYILGLSGDKKLANISGITEIMNCDKGSVMDYGKHQLTMLVGADSLEELEINVAKVVDAMKYLGIVHIREDIRMEDCFWSQLPANFAFAKRLTPINTRRMAGFASLYNFPAGKAVGNKWGNAITVFHTANGTPYFFNFHYKNNGHTAIIGPKGSGKTVLLNFLVSQVQKKKCRTFFFDYKDTSHVFIRAIGGKVYDLIEDISLNPFQMEDSERNRGFLQNFLQSLITSAGEPVTEADMEVLKSAVEHSYTLPKEKRKLSNIAAFLKEKSDLAEKIGWWYGDGMYARLFDNTADTLDLFDGSIHGFEMEKIVEAGEPIFPVMLYLSHRISQTLDGRETVVVLDEAWKLIDNKLFSALIPGWLDYLKANNAIAILSSSDIEDISESSITNSLLQKIPTQLYLPNKKATYAYHEVFGLTDEEFALLKKMKQKYHHFLLKYKGESIVGTLNLEGMDDLLAVLSGNPESVKIMQNAIVKAGDKPNDWLLMFLQEYLDIMKKQEVEIE